MSKMSIELQLGGIHSQNPGHDGDEQVDHVFKTMS